MSQFSFFVFVASLFTLAVCDRPIYNIGHMVNNQVYQIDAWLGYGSNALEADVDFNDDGTPGYFYHGTPCDPGRDCTRWAYVDRYVNALRDRTLPSSSKLNRKLVLMMFDCKLGDVSSSVYTNAGRQFVNTILKPLYRNNPTKMKVIISVPNLSMSDFVRSVINTLKREDDSILDKIGWDISYEYDRNTPQELEQALKELGVRPGYAWLSYGISSGLVGNNIKGHLRTRVQYRDTNEGHFFSKVYGWTIDRQSTALAYLNLKLDGIIANYPGRVNNAIGEFNQGKSAADRIRLATLDDNPFAIYNPTK